MNAGNRLQDARAVVTALLAAQGIDAVPDEELDILAGLLPSIAGRMARLHAIDCGDGGPMLLGMRAVAPAIAAGETSGAPS